MHPDSDPLHNPRFESLLSQLRGLPTPSPSPDFMNGVMARLHPPQIHSRKRSVQIWISTAAVIIFLFTASSWIINIRESFPSPKALIMAAQRPDGSWPAATEGIHSRYDTSVTALALLALMREDSTGFEGPKFVAIQAGINHLIRQQNPAGQFDAHSSGIQFTPYLAGMALQMAAQLPHAQMEWGIAAAQITPYLPSAAQMAKLNRFLAHSDSFPSCWVDAGGPVALAAIQLLEQSSTPI